MTDGAWADFRQTAFGDPYLVWHDGPDFSALRDQWRAEPDRVERMLLQGMRENDDLASQAIGELHDLAGAAAPRLEAALREQLGRASGTRRVRIAESLRAYTGSDEWDRHVGQSLDEPNFWSERVVAAMALRRATPTRDLIEVLARGVLDEEYLVRYHSANSLSSWGGGAAIEDRDDLFRDLVTGSSPDRWANVASVLAEQARSRLPI